MNVAEQPATIHRVPGDIAIRVTDPEVGMRILINNAGGFHQSPGRYGYTETVVLDIEHENAGTPRQATRIRTDAYGWGCWVVGPRRVKVRA